MDNALTHMQQALIFHCNF